MTETDVYEGGVTTADFGPDDDDTALEGRVLPPGAPPASDDAPYGWTRDKETGGWRPKKRPGRPHRPPSAEELAAAPPATPLPPDQAPATGRKPPRPPADDVPMPRAGTLAAGINKLYRRAGRILKAFDEDLGRAVIECTKRDPEDDTWLPVGEAWEELCRTNPGIRRFWVRAIAGGAWGDVFMAHAPLGMALLMKPAIQRMIPLHRLAGAFLGPDEDTGEEGFAGMSAEDVEKMAAQVEGDIARVAAQLPPDVVEKMAAAASTMAQQGSGITPPYEQHNLDGNRAQRRAQPRRPQPRAKRAR